MYKYLTDSAKKCVLSDDQYISIINGAPQRYVGNRCINSIEYDFSDYTLTIQKIFSIYGIPIRFCGKSGEDGKYDITYYYSYEGSNTNLIRFTIRCPDSRHNPYLATIAHLDGLNLYIGDYSGLKRLLLLLLIDPLQCIHMIRAHYKRTTSFFDILETAIYNHDTKYFLLREMARCGWLVNDLVVIIMNMYLSLCLV